MAGHDKTKPFYPGASAVEQFGWLRAHRFLLLRRLCQAGVIGLFLLGPLAGIWIVKGNIASSLTLEFLPLTDPYILLQSIFARHWPEATGFIGAAIVLVFYLLVGGRAYCSWVCPINPVTDAAAWLRRRLRVTSKTSLHRNFRYWILGLTLVLGTATGMMMWEPVNPVTTVFRGLVFGMTTATWLVLLAIFLFDTFLARRGWCGHLCPVGAFYSLPGLVSPVRVSAVQRDRCDNCMDCYAVCPEPQVISPALKPKGSNDKGPMIVSPNCTNCGRCIDVCSKDVFAFRIRHPGHSPSHHQQPATTTEVSS